MTDDPTEVNRRRRRVVGIALGAVGLAGCLGASDTLNDDSTADDSEESDDEERENMEENGTNGENGDNNGTAEPKEREPVPPAIEAGDLITGFDELDLWGALPGSHTVTLETDGDDRVQGEHSLLATTEENDTVGAFTAFPGGLDVEGKHVSAAVKVESDQRVALALELMAPHQSDRVTSVRRVFPELDDWFRVDFGYTSQRGEPHLQSVQELRLYARTPEEGTIRLHVDDLRKTEAAEQGAVIPMFIGALSEYYETALPILDEYGVPGTIAVPTPQLNAPNRLDIGQLRELRDEGWDVIAHPFRSERLYEMSTEEKRNVLEMDHEYLKRRGFPNGARHFSSPTARLDGETLSIVREIYHTGFVYGANTNALPTTDPYALSRVDGNDIEEVRRLIRLASRYNNLLVILFEGIGEDGMVTEEDLENYISYFEERDLRVITPTQLVDEY